ncbi:energy-coupling factor ABC transporter permease [Pelagimonas varians]|uniref:Cobalt transport protein CbiM n=1 Tax=Pelagimonas varians TaxID=696760 RepID=A0A238K6M7_9RHOB|nr:energy-coupling factor ABC transporter permease [Pelagimonas varians]PYG31797.1 cobalt uptake protein with substrate-specific transmembrane region [Pelagimonas varians]SMX38560.1 cobalt transport protein CbiM [Pelagimonas varians]
MHVEPGIVDAAKIGLSYATAAAAGGVATKMAIDTVRESGVSKMAARTAIATVATFSFFQILPHFPVGVSEVHFILGSTLFLMLGAAPAAFGLAIGLLLQGMFFAPTDLPMYFVNVTTLLVPLMAMSALAKRIITPGTAYVDLSYKQTLALSTAFQGGVVAWVAFWAFYGQGFGAMSSVMSFGAAYMMVILIEPLIDLACLAGAKSIRDIKASGILASRVYNA